MPNQNHNSQVPNSREAPKSKDLNQGKKGISGGGPFKDTLSKLEKKPISFPSVAEEGKFKDINS